MSNIKKYINYVTDDLIKKTDVDHDRHSVKYPWGGLGTSTSNTVVDMYFFKNFIINTYGVSEGEEIQMVKDFYEDKLIYKISQTTYPW